MRVVSADGASLLTEHEGHGPPFLMVHGFTGAKEDFADHAPCFARHHTVITFDLRGHGESDHPAELASYSFDLLVADALAVADAHDAERFVLLGHSMGGMVARRLVLEHPELLIVPRAGHSPQFENPDVWYPAVDEFMRGVTT